MIDRRERPSSIVRPQPDSSTAHPSTSPSCGQQPLHRPGGSSRSRQHRGSALSVLGWSLWDLFMGGTHCRHRRRSAAAAPPAARAGRSADRARRGAALAHARRFGATKANAAQVVDVHTFHREGAKSPVHLARPGHVGYVGCRIGPYRNGKGIISRVAVRVRSGCSRYSADGSSHLLEYEERSRRRDGRESIDQRVRRSLGNLT